MKKLLKKSLLLILIVISILAILVICTKNNILSGIQKTQVVDYSALDEPEVYSVTLETNGGTLYSGDITSYTYGTFRFLPTKDEIIRDNYIFMGWYEEPDFSGNRVISISETDEGDKTYYAKWDPYGYTVTLETNGGSIKEGCEVTGYEYGIGAELPTGEEIIKKGHTFGGWYKNADLTEEEVTAISTTDEGDKTYYAKWVANTYKLTFVTNSGSLMDCPEETSYTYGTFKFLPTKDEIIRDNYIFMGWYEEPDFSGNQVISISETDEGDKTYYAKWDPYGYEVTLEANGGTINRGDVTSYTYGIGATLPTDVTRDGHTFVGWYENSDFSGSSITNISITDIGDKTYYAKWTPNIYTVTFKDGEEILKEITVRYEEEAQAPVIVGRKGYYLTWDTEDYKCVKNDLTVNAVWKVDSYSIMFVTYGGIINSENVTEVKTGEKYLTSYTYGIGTTLPTNVTKEGYIFAGWYEKEDFTGEVVTVIGKDEAYYRTYFAKWVEEKEYYITSEKYSINMEEKQITKVSPRTNVTSFINNLDTNGEVKILNNEGIEVTGEDLIGTGYKLEVNFKGIKYEYEIAVRGDLDGNGKITTTDLSVLNQIMVKSLTVTGIRQRASDLDFNNKTSITDLSMMHQTLCKTIIL